MKTAYHPISNRRVNTLVNVSLRYDKLFRDGLVLLKNAAFAKSLPLTSHNPVKYFPTIKIPPIASTHRKPSAHFPLSSTTLSLGK